MSFSYLRERNSEDRGSFDTGSDDAVIESAKGVGSAEEDADHEAAAESPLSREEMAEVFGLSPEDFEEFIERTTCFEFDGSEIVARPA